MTKSISESKRTVYVTGLPLEALHHEVKSFFSKFGLVRSVYLNSNEFYKFAFVGFFKEESVDAVMNVNAPLVLHEKEFHVKRRTTRSVDEDQLPPPAYIEDDLSLPSSEALSDMPEAVKSAEAQTLRYGTNGELGFGSDPCNPEQANSNRVIRADGIPIDWKADDLFKHLASVGLAVTAVMVYDDYDERRFRQGLIQLESERDASKLVQKGFYNTPILKLEILPSSVPSIGPVRSNYGGRFTAFNIKDNSASHQEVLLKEFSSPAKQTMGSENAAHKAIEEEHQLERLKPSMSSSHWWQTPSPSGLQNSMLHNSRSSLPYMPGGSPNKASSSNGSFASAFSDSCDWSPQTPPSAISASPDAFRKKRIGLSPLIESPVTPGDRSPPQGHQSGSVLYHNSLKDQSTAYRTANGMELQLPTPYHKASQTVIVDNLSSGLIYDSKALAASMSQYGQVQYADLVPISAKHARAYVTFSSPAIAELALSHLSAYSPGSERLIVRLA